MRGTTPIASVVVAALLVVTATGCTDDDEDSSRATAEPTSSTTTSSTIVPSFTGDPDSDFCRLVRTAGERPVLDPFERGIEPREVELRFRNLRNRFAEFAEVAPPELSSVLGELLTALDELGAILEDHDFDFAQVADSGADASVFDDPAFEDAAVRIEAYDQQVCEGGN